MLPKRLDEDLAFSMVLMLVNSTLVFIGLEYWLDPTDSSGIFPLIISAGFFAVQISFYCWYWPRLARGLSAWPDGFAPSSGSMDQLHGNNPTDETKGA